MLGNNVTQIRERLLCKGTFAEVDMQFVVLQNLEKKFLSGQHAPAGIC
jgi:hypothetical protein